MDDSETNGGTEGGRARRQKQDKTGRFAALQKLKELKGSKNKCDVTDVDNVYEEVDEREYSKRVQQRQEDDWIIDDDGSGYVEDGREVFDDDLDDEHVGNSKGTKTRGRKKDSSKSGGPVKTSNIKNMFLNIPSKNKEKEAKIKEDDILGDIMQELHSAPTSTSLRPTMTGLKRKVATPSSLGPPKALNPSSIINRTPTSALRGASNYSVSRTVKAEPKRLPFDTACEGASASQNSIEEFVSQPDESPFIDDNESMDIDDFPSQTEMEDLEAKSKKAETKIDVKKEDLKDQSTFVSSDVDLTSGWETIKNNVSMDQSSINVPDFSTGDELPLIKDENGDQMMQMYWLDAFEDPYLQPGTVYLFGKTFIESAQSYVSCCVIVKHIERHIYVLPRDTAIDLKTGQNLEKQVGFMDVYEEFNTRIAERYKILQFKSRRVTKKYAFEPPTVPRESEYLEVKYISDYPALPPNLKGSTFSHVFGTNQTALENFLLEKRIKGPCWLNIKNPVKANPPVSWCKVEAVATNMNQIELVPSGMAPPPLTVMSLSLRTVVNSRSQQVEIVAAACLVHHQFHVDKAAPQPPFQQHFCILSRPTEEPWPLDLRDSLSTSKVTKIERTEGERALLSLLLAKVNKIDPDIVVGHDIASFDLDILLHRFAQNKVDRWSRLGRLRRTNMPQSKGIHRSHLAMSGRLVCDVKLSARELIRARSYDLETLCQQVLNVQGGRPDLESDAVKRMYSASKSLLGLVSITMNDGANTLRLMYELNVMPLALQITSIAGNLLSRTLLGGRSERNEYLLLHAFHERGYIVPDRQIYDKKGAKGGHNSDNEEESTANETTKSNQKGRRKPAYTGGLVLDPKRGFYDKYILLMDFNSLYPSIIQEFNICFTTVDRQTPTKSKDEEEILPDLPDPSLAAGILPTEIRKLVDSRREVKKLIKDNLHKDLMLQYDIRQKALKLTANSMYGCLGFSHSRFYAKPLAALITAKGREILLQTRELVRKLNLDVIYGDTDSLMIDSNSNDFDQVMKLGSKIKVEVNKLYKHLELDVDGVFQRLLLLKKKKYAAVTVTRGRDGSMVTQQEIKGLDIVRRDWSQLAIQSGKYALEQILGDVPADERVARIQQNLEKIREDFEKGTIDVSLLEITKQLTKNPENYPDGKNLPHVQVALRVNTRGGKKLIHGDTVSYIICQDGSNMAATQRAYTVDEIKNNTSLKPDVQYYLAQQVHPVVSRLCELLEGIDNVRIAEFLGLDPSGYRASHRTSNNEDETGSPPMSDEERFAASERFQFKCPAKECGAEIVMDSVFRRKENGDIEYALARCVNPNCKVVPSSYVPMLMNRLTLAIRKHVQRYYAGWLICEDQSCATRTRRLPLKFTRAQPRCLGCANSNMDLEYNDSQLYTQLCFYQYIFNVQKAQTQLQPSEKDKVKIDYQQSLANCYTKLRDHVSFILQQSSYSQVDLSELFEVFRIKIAS